MHRSFRALLLLLVMAWQTLGWLSPGAVAAQAEQVMHATMHAQADAHHHHDDPSLAVDEGGNNTTHWHADSALQPPCLPPGSAPPVARATPEMPPPRHERAVLPPLPDGLYRPPQTAT